MSERLVRGADLLDPVCAECQHVEGFHGPMGCRFGQFVVGDDADVQPCGCKRTHHDVHLAHIESIVRREVAKALRSEAEGMERYRKADSYGDDFDGGVGFAQDALRDHAAAIESGGQS